MFYIQKTREEIHLSMIKTRIEGYRKNGHIGIKADHIGYPYAQPDGINGQRPDITSWKDQIFYITEVETCEGIGTTDTAAQWKAFSEEAIKHNGKFHVVVPASCYEKAIKFAREEKIYIDFWFTNTDF